MERQYTLLKESEMLIKSGLDAETADGWVDDSDRFSTVRGAFSIARSWTLGRLLELLPPSIVVGGEEYYFRIGKYYVPSDEGVKTEVVVAYTNPDAVLAGDFIGYSTLSDKCTFLECVASMVCWVCGRTSVTKGSGVSVVGDLATALEWVRSRMPKGDAAPLDELKGRGLAVDADEYANSKKQGL